MKLLTCSSHGDKWLPTTCETCREIVRHYLLAIAEDLPEEQAALLRRHVKVADDSARETSR